MNTENRYRRQRPCRGDKNGRYIFGIMLIVLGGLLFASKAGLLIPRWIFSWPMILIAVGFAVGVSQRFKGTGWIWPMAIGAFFLAERAFPNFFPREFFWPVFMVVAGLILILGPRRWNTDKAARVAAATLEGDPVPGTMTDRLDESTVFGTVRKFVISKTFRGGEVSTVFGSAEINLLQADFDTPPKLELNAVFGSIRLIVPSHWQLKMENNAVLGGVEDKRPQHSIYSDKIMYLEANAVFGGIQITTV
ncbi:DUF5668 domain-containing protein [Flavihumibacter sp. RY-1]|uniref:DUF5668 domain-containing protein n=1 Tax=Flavihumibacter fluminis TaxID=2909236 RepID=A0ABS9BLS6_9BACT|nr:DUF5668 domain-containing protein [Flavihumibacter fluminis]MCF1716661.1 DUF5668 domain-containing protein [Flavihumibacter fluminis]